MSSLMYGALTRRRDEAPKEQSTSSAPPDVRTYADGLSALFSAEVLGLHAFMIEVTTSTTKVDGQAVTIIDDPEALRATFVVCLVFSVGLCAFGRLVKMKGKWKRSDYLRARIPALAFVVWTILQKSTAWDAGSPDSLSEGDEL